VEIGEQHPLWQRKRKKKIKTTGGGEKKEIKREKSKGCCSSIRSKYRSYRGTVAPASPRHLVRNKARAKKGPGKRTKGGKGVILQWNQEISIGEEENHGKRECDRTDIKKQLNARPTRGGNRGINI